MGQTKARLYLHPHHAQLLPFPHPNLLPLLEVFLKGSPSIYHRNLNPSQFLGTQPDITVGARGEPRKKI